MTFEQEKQELVEQHQKRMAEISQKYAIDFETDRVKAALECSEATGQEVQRFRVAMAELKASLAGRLKPVETITEQELRELKNA